MMELLGDGEKNCRCCGMSMKRSDHCPACGCEAFEEHFDRSCLVGRLRVERFDLLDALDLVLGNIGEQRIDVVTHLG